MAYFRDTNIDDEFGKPKKKLFSIKKKNNKKNKDGFEDNRKKFVFIIGGIILLLVMIILGIILFNRDNGYYIVLEGDSEITIYEETDYIELGYHGYDKKGNEVTHLVNVDNQVDTSKIGKYEITYSLSDAVVKRYVNVIDKGVGDTYINLSGDMEIHLKLGENYTEPGYLVLDTVDGDLTSKVVVNNNVNTSKPGNYKIVYSVVNSSGVTTSITRTVIVLGAEISLILSNNNKTTGSININVSVDDNYFSYLVLPNGSKVSENTYSYKVSSNGTYKFTSYDKFGNKTERSITVSNIVVDTGNNGSGSSGGSSSGGTGSSGNNGNSKISVPKVYVSDNIGSGNKHSVGFLVKLTGNNTIYYCLDSNNTCNPSTKYIGELRFASSQQKYLRYRACNSSNQCSNIGSYHVNLNIQLVNPKTSSSDGMANPHQVAYYYQADSRWADYYVSSYKMRKVGCGFNAFSMILTGITHNYEYTPDVVFKALKQIKQETGVVFQDSYTGGGLLDTAVLDKNVENYFKYEADSLFKYKFNASWDSNSLIAEKKEKMVESLKMGHMLLLRVPNHFIALVGINENDDIYVFNSGTSGTYMKSIDELFESYKRYYVNASYGKERNIALAYEMYPKGGISLANWNKIG